MGEGGAGTGPEYDTLYSANMQMLELLLRGGSGFALSLEMVAVALKQKNPLTPLAGPPLIMDQFFYKVFQNFRILQFFDIFLHFLS